MAVSLCAMLAAIYLTVEAQDAKERELARIYRWRALMAGAGTAALGAYGLLLAPTEAPLLWDGMLNHTLPPVITPMLFGAATAIMLLLEK